MSKLAYEIKKLECLPFDRRVVERNLTTGVVSRKDYEKHVHALKDLIDESEEFQVTVGPEEETKAVVEEDDAVADEEDAADDAPSA